MNLRKTACLSMAVAGLGLFARPAQAADKAWEQPSGGSFDSAANWGPEGPPKGKDVVRFNLAEAYTVTLTANRVNSRFLVGNDKLVLDLGGKRYKLGSAKPMSLVLGLHEGDAARMSLRNGTFANVSALIGGAAGSNAKITVGPGAIWKNLASLSIGGQGNGGMAIVGGKVASKDAKVGTGRLTRGTLTLSGGDSLWSVTRNLAVGGSTKGSGMASVGNGAVLDVGGTLSIGKTGTVTVNGGVLSAGYINKIGKLNFDHGTMWLTNSNLLIQRGGVFGSRLELDSSKALNVVKTATVGSGSVVTVSGGRFAAGRIDNLGEISLGGGESLLGGTNLSNRGLIHGSGTIGSMSIENLGTMSFESSSSQVAGRLLNGEGGRISIDGALARFSGSVVHDGAAFHVSPGSTAEFLADVSGSGNFDGGGVLKFDGVYAPDGLVPSWPANDERGEAIGGVSIDGSVAFGDSAKLMLDLGAGRQADRLAATGAVHLHDVDIALSPDFVAVAGDRYELVSTGYPNGIEYGGQIHVPDLANGLSFAVDAGPQALTLTVVPEPGAGALVLLGSAALLRRRRRA